MERLLQHIDLISRQRNRAQLEAGLVEALHELTGAERVRLYKLFAPPGDLMVGLAAEAAGAELRMLDDGISWPAGTGSLDQFPHLQACLADGRFDDVEPERGLPRHAFAIDGIARQAFGMATLECAKPLDAAQSAIVAGLVTLFRNCVALLDYSEIDTLTGLLNRKTFDEYLINILSRVANEGDMAAPRHGPRRRKPSQHAQSHWLGVIDVDHFKSINDGFGHLIGDEVLILVANMMKAAFRSQDKLFRFGGEEFVVLLKPTDLANACAIFERYRKAIDEHVFPQVGHVSISIGFTRIGLYDTPSIILDDADEALYYAKGNGRNRVCCYEELVGAGVLTRRQQVLHTDVELF
ncbi:MAG: GGDEF domain-containing protein [Ignavibacteria bacterium]